MAVDTSISLGGWQQGGETVAVFQISLMPCRWVPISGRLKMSEGQGRKNEMGTSTPKGRPRGHFTNDVLSGFNLPPAPESCTKHASLWSFQSECLLLLLCKSWREFSNQLFKTQTRFIYYHEITKKSSKSLHLRSSNQQIFNIFACNGLIDHQNSWQVSFHRLTAQWTCLLQLFKAAMWNFFNLIITTSKSFDGTLTCNRVSGVSASPTLHQNHLYFHFVTRVGR